MISGLNRVENEEVHVSIILLKPPDVGVLIVKEPSFGSHSPNLHVSPTLHPDTPLTVTPLWPELLFELPLFNTMAKKKRADVEEVDSSLFLALSGKERGTATPVPPVISEKCSRCSVRTASPLPFLSLCYVLLLSLHSNNVGPCVRRRSSSSLVHRKQIT